MEHGQRNVFLVKLLVVGPPVPQLLKLTDVRQLRTPERRTEQRPPFTKQPEKVCGVLWAGFPAALEYRPPTFHAWLHPGRQRQNEAPQRGLDGGPTFISRHCASSSDHLLAAGKQLREVGRKVVHPFARCGE